MTRSPMRFCGCARPSYADGRCLACRARDPRASLSVSEQMSLCHGDIRVWAEAYRKATGRYPNRRWRLERSYIGNSRLSTEAEARAIGSLVGGDVVEVIPSAAGFTKREEGEGTLADRMKR